MNYKITSFGIEILDHSEFNIKHILECGQVFRYKPTDFGYTVYSKEHKADIYCQKDCTKIFCKNKKYFIKYFDLDANYATIKSAISTKDYIQRAVEFGYGIRILRQDPLEMLVSFIISANNNIPRIRKAIESICEAYGTDMGDYHAFPTIDQLVTIDQAFFEKAGCGYRAPYLVDTIRRVYEGFDLDKLAQMPMPEAREQLLTLKGVGPKVADCILLFGYHYTDVFPTDTWIIQAYNALFGNTNMNVKQINAFFKNMFGKFSGYAQQYLFYSKREKSF